MSQNVQSRSAQNPVTLHPTELQVGFRCFAARLLPLIFVAAGFTVLPGCHDGPMYALKRVNPYYVMQWNQDRELGVTDHERREQLMKLSNQIGSFPVERQRYWAEHLTRIMKDDPSAEMRRLVVVAASRLKTNDAMPLLEKGLADTNLKVRMAACEGLGRRSEPSAAKLLAATYGMETDQDVRNAAIEAMGKHKGEIPIDTLRMALKEQDPATAHLAMASLRGVTGKDLGSTPQEWIAALEQQSPAATDPNGTSPKVRMASSEESVVR